MAKTRAFALLLVAGLSAGATTTALPLSSAAESPTQTMAEIYQPYYEFVEVRTDGSYYHTPSGEFPRDTRFKLREHNNYGLYYKQGPFTISVSPSGSIFISQYLGALSNYGPEGATTDLGVIVTYPDGSSEFITASANIASMSASLAQFYYPDVFIEEGGTATVPPRLGGPSAVRYSLVPSAELDSYRGQGWDIAIDSSSGEVTISAPSAFKSIEVFAQAIYEDGSSEIETISVFSEPEPMPEPEPEPDTPEPEPEPDTPEPEPEPDTPEPPKNNSRGSSFSSSS